MFDLREMLDAYEAVQRSRERLTRCARQMPGDVESIAICAEEERVLRRWIRWDADRKADRILRADDTHSAILEAEWAGEVGWDAFWQIARWASERVGGDIPHLLKACGLDPWAASAAAAREEVDR